MPIRTYTWKNGKLKLKDVFKKENNLYTRIYSLYNFYKDINAKEYINLRALSYISVTLNTAGQGISDGDKNIFTCYDQPDYSQYAGAFGGRTPVDYFNYYTTTGLHVLESSTETIDGVTKQTYYDSYNSYGFPTQVRTVLSSGKTQQATYKYPVDLAGTTIYNEMINRNIVSPVVETKEYVNGSFTNFHRTQYGMNHPANANLIAPVSEDYQSGSQNAPETRITYNRYDAKGNLSYISKDNADQVVYLWGYNYLYLIAEIKGATYTEVEAAAKTVFSVASIDALSALATPNETKLTDGSLQKALPNALVTTYTYKPLVGMLSMTDPHGVVTKYDYDSFGRLIKVTQADKVIETYDYHYK